MQATLALFMPALSAQVLPSDQVYSFDFTQLVDFHRQTNAVGHWPYV